MIVTYRRAASPKSISRTKPSPLGLCLILLLWAPPALTGCAPTPKPVITTAAPREMIPVGQLAAWLGMRVQRSTRWSASMGDSMNTLLLMAPPRAGAVLNGRRIGGDGDVAVVGTTLTVGRALADRIRSQRRREPATAPPATLPVSARRRPTATGLVVLDAGHGGKDPGAGNKYGPSESILVVDTVLRISRALEGGGIRTILTRSDNTFVELEERANIANGAGADLFVSIHADAHPNDPDIDGFTVYVARQSSKASAALGQEIMRTMKPLCPGCRGLRKSDFRVLTHTKMPAVLVELGYLTNRAEATKLSSAAYRQQLAEAIAEAIINHLSR